MDVERQPLVLEEREDERRCQHYAQQTGASEANERGTEWHPPALLDEARDGIGGCGADDKRRRLGHSFVEVPGDRDAQPEDEEPASKAQHELDEEKEQRQEDVGAAE